MAGSSTPLEALAIGPAGDRPAIGSRRTHGKVTAADTEFSRGGAHTDPGEVADVDGGDGAAAEPTYRYVVEASPTGPVPAFLLTASAPPWHGDGSGGGAVSTRV